MTRKPKAEMKASECPQCCIGHRCCQTCKVEQCVHYVDETLPNDTEEYGRCLLWQN